MRNPIELKSDESGQTTTEYLLLLAVAVLFAIILMRMLKPAFTSLQTKIQNQIDHGIFNSGDLSTFRF